MDEEQSQLVRYAQDLRDLLTQHQALQADIEALKRRIHCGAALPDQLIDFITRASMPLVVTDLDGEVLRVNAEASGLLEGHPAAPVPQANLAQFMDPACEPQLSLLLGIVSLNPSHEAALSGFWSFRVPGQAGHYQRCHALVLPVRSLPKPQMYWVLRALAEDEPIASMSLARRLGLRSRTHSIFVTDPNGRITAANGAACRVSGFELDELLQQPMSLLSAASEPGALESGLPPSLEEFGLWSGEISARMKQGRRYTEWVSLRAVDALGGGRLGLIRVSRDMSENEPGAESLVKLAYSDPLTGLANRRLLEDRISKAIKGQSPSNGRLSLLFIDLDHFKPVNDLHGHALGDLVLRQVAKRLQSAIRGDDTVARLGGDEFVVLLLGAAEEADIERVAAKLRSVVREPIQIGEHAIHLGASIGCARFPRDGQDPASLLRNADAAMYASKRGGGDRLSFYGDHAALPDVETLGENLEAALANQTLRLVFQPMVLPGPPHVLHGCRALSRWAHPRLGLIDPRDVVPVVGRAERTAELDRWAVGAACHQLSRWRREGLRHFVVRVAVGPALLQTSGAAASIKHMVLAADLQATDLELEITVDGDDPLDGELHAEIESLQRSGVRVLMQDPEAEADSRFLGAFLPEFQMGHAMEADRISEWARHMSAPLEQPTVRSELGGLASPHIVGTP